MQAKLAEAELRLEMGNVTTSSKKKSPIEKASDAEEISPLLGFISSGTVPDQPKSETAAGGGNEEIEPKEDELATC